MFLERLGPLGSFGTYKGKPQKHLTRENKSSVPQLRENNVDHKLTATRQQINVKQRKLTEINGICIILCVVIRYCEDPCVDATFLGSTGILPLKAGFIV